ncbi:MAG TPA: class I SAM-dependent methyltransferase [Thermoanaerobaculia bacterium]|nr:class I SAM-dependent methyltransferase [Thermoanaerobaculia bacterium]
MKDSFVEKPPEGAEGWERVWRENLRYKAEKPPTRFRALLNRLLNGLRDGQRADLARQRDFNLATLDLLADARRDVSDGRRDLESLQSSFGRELQQIQSDLMREIAALRELLPVVAGRNDALMSALDRKIETVSARVRDLSLPLLQGQAPSEFRSDFVYRRLEDALRGGEEELAGSLTPYLDFAFEHQPVIDLGCGRGEFLQLCRTRGISALGFDSNERSVSDLKAAGLDVSLEMIPGCLSGIGDSSVGSIFASHVVEHLPFSELLTLFSSAARILKRGGLFMIETPNASSLFMAGSEFWRDPTHLAPRHAAALALIGREVGFDVARVQTLHPFSTGHELQTTSEDPALQALVSDLNKRVFGDQDLRLILRKA